MHPEEGGGGGGDDDAFTFSAGEYVKVFGLVKMHELNGKSGEILCRQKDRYVIRLGGGIHAIKPTCVERAEKPRDAAAHGAAGDARSPPPETPVSEPQQQHQKQSRKRRHSEMEDSSSAQPAAEAEPVAAAAAAADPQQVLAAAILLQQYQQQQQQQQEWQRQQALAGFLAQAMQGGPQQQQLAAQVLGGMVGGAGGSMQPNQYAQQPQQGYQQGWGGGYGGGGGGYDGYGGGYGGGGGGGYYGGGGGDGSAWGEDRRKKRRTDGAAGGGGGGEEGSGRQAKREAGCVVLAVFRDGVERGTKDEGGEGFAAADPDEIFCLFSQFGVVEKISVFSKDDNVQALVQFDTSASAMTALSYLNGRSCWAGRYSPDPEYPQPVVAVMRSAHKELNFPKRDYRNREYFSLNDELTELLAAVEARGGDRPHNSCGDETMKAELAERHPATRLRGFLWGRPLAYGEGWLDPVQKDEEQWTVPKPEGSQVRGKVGDVLLLGGLPPNTAATKFWGLAGVFGEVIAVKMLQRRVDSCLIQYMNSSQADNAIKALTGVKLGESGLLHAQRSKHSNALNWKGAQTGLERFMCTQDERPSPKCFMNSPPPTSTAVLSDVPEAVLESQAAMSELSEKLGVDQSQLTVDGGNVSVATNSVQEACDLVCTFNGLEIDTCEGAVKAAMFFS